RFADVGTGTGKPFGRSGRAGAGMNQAVADQIARAVLYEGYLLYPYRPAVKNCQRWTFGGLYPASCCRDQKGADSWFMQTECLVRGDRQTAIQVKVRFLHLMARLVGEMA